MKRLLLVAAALVLTLGLTGGCVSVETYDNEGQTVSINVGRQFVIALGANDTTGYSWEASYDETMLELVESTYEVEETDEPLMGAGGIRYFRFKALVEGKTEITLVYAPQWDRDDVAETKVFTIVID